MRSHHSLILAAALALSMLVVACDQRPADPALPTLDINWSTITTFRGEFPITSLWASGPDNIYAGQTDENGHGDVIVVGSPSVWRYDGSTWSVVDVSIAGEHGSPSIWGSGENDVYLAVDKLHHFDGATWSVEPIDADWVTGTSKTQVFAANRFAVLRFDGAEWDTLRTSTGMAVHGLSATGDGSLFISASGTISIWDGVSWTDTTVPNDCPYAVKAFAIDDAFAIGGCTGRIYHWDGTAWTPTPDPPRHVQEMAGTGATGLFAVGGAGYVQHYDGVSWHELPRPTAINLNAIAVAGSEIVVAGDSFKAASWNGSEWRLLHEASPERAYQIFAESPTRIMVDDGCSLFQFRDAHWSETPLPSGYAPAIGGSSLDDMFASAGTGIFHYDGTKWSLSDSLVEPQSLFWQSPSGALYSVGLYSAYRYDGTWVRIYDGNLDFRAVAGDGDRIVAVSRPGLTTRTQAVMRFDGDKWVELPSPADYINAVWVDPGMDIYLAGNKGVYRWNGERFRRLSPKGLRGFGALFGIGNGRVVAISEDRVGLWDGSLFNLVQTEEVLFTVRANDGTLISETRSGLASWRP